MGGKAAMEGKAVMVRKTHRNIRPTMRAPILFQVNK